MKFNVVKDQEQERCQKRFGLCSVFIAFGNICVGVGALGRALVQPYPRSAHALRTSKCACRFTCEYF